MTNQDNLTLADATKPIVERETIKSAFKGEKLDKEKGNWTQLRPEIQNYLDMIGLSSHLVANPSATTPSPTLPYNPMLTITTYLMTDPSRAILNLPSPRTNLSLLINSKLSRTVGMR